MNSTLQYILQIGLCLVTVGAIFLALTSKPLSRTLRMIAAVCPIIFGAIWYFITKEESGFYALLMGFVALVFVFVHPRKKIEGDTDKTENE